MRAMQNKRWIILLPLLSLFLVLFLSAAQAEGAQVSGYVYFDRNNNGKMDGNEAGVVNAKIYLQKKSDSGETKDLSSKTIDRDGAYAFAVNKAGEYRLRVELPKEYYFTIHGKGSLVLPTQKNKGYSDYFILEDGSAEIMNVGGIKSSVALTVVSFVDTNANGGRANNEPTLRGVQAELIYQYEDKTYVIAKSTSDKTGNLSIRDLSPATYYLRVTLPDNYVIGPKGEKANVWYNRINPTEDGSGISDPLVLEPGHTGGLAVGAVETGSLQGSLWFDENYNGRQDAGEKGLTDAKVLLISPSLNLTRETTPDASGNYAFTGLQPGDYKVGVQLADGLVFTYPGATQISTIGSYGETAAYVEVKQTTTVRPIGAMPAATLQVGFMVDDNLDDIWDEGEAALAGVAVTAVQNGQTVETKLSGEDGYVTFSSLRSGEATITCQLPEGYIFEIRERENLTVDSVTNVYTVTVPLSGESGENAYWQGLLSVTEPASIQGVLFEDPDNTGVYTEECVRLAGFAVQAVAEDGKVLAQAVTSSEGEYILSPLPAGVYTVRFLLNDPYVASPFTENNAIFRQSPAFGETQAISLVPAQTVTQVDGAVFRAGVAEGVVANSRGGGLRGVTATLLNDQGEPVSDFSYGVTGDDGAFMIKGILPGTYTVRYTLPETVAFTDPATDQKEYTSASFTITSGAEIQLPALQGEYTASLSGFVGQEDGDHAVTADLVLTSHASGQSIPLTAEEGSYRFAGLRPGTYSLQVTLPEGYVFGQWATSPFGPDAHSVSTVEFTLSPEENRVADIRAALPVDLSGVIFYDANRSAVQDDDEPAASDRGLSLWLNGSLAAQVTTDENGEFFASHLVPGDYTLRMTLQDNEVMVGLDASQQDNEWSFPIPLDADQFLSIPVLRYALVTGSVWNLDGSNNKVDGIVITLLDENGSALGTINTNENGDFGFSKLLPGVYSLSAQLPRGFLFAREQDTAQRKSMIQTSDSGESVRVPFTVPMGKKVTGMDIGMGSIGRIGDKAWLDENGNGMQDIGEIGMPGIVIELYKNGELAASATTDLYGRYLIDNLYPGEYEMHVTMHKELKATKHETAFPLVASIMPESSDTTVVFSGVIVPSGGENLHCDLGFQLRTAGVYPSIMDQIPTKDWTPYSERK